MNDILQRLRDLSPGYGNIIADAIAEIESLRAKCAEVERLRRELAGIAEFCSTDNTRTGALMRLAAIRNTAYQALRHS